MIELPLHFAKFLFFYFTDVMLDMSSMTNGNLTSLKKKKSKEFHKTFTGYLFINENKQDTFTFSLL
jgi:hypothetical protein